MRAVIEFGTASDTWYEWNDIFLVIRWEAEGDPTISIEFSLPSSNELEAGFREDSNAFEHYIGLDNLAISDRPTDIFLNELRHEFFLTSYWGYGSYAIAELRVATATDGTGWHVIDATRNQIVGTYTSQEDLERSVVEETGLVLFAEIDGHSRQREWIPSRESLAAVLAEQAE